MGDNDKSVESVEVVATKETCQDIQLAASSLSEKERNFCDLFAGGVAPYAGNPIKCYEEVFGQGDIYSGTKAYMLLAKSEIQDYLSCISARSVDEAKYIKQFLTTTMMHIVEEMSQNVVQDRFGTTLSPAPSRSVAVSAAKVLMDLFPIKENQGDMTINNKNGGNITFNVIAPGGLKNRELEDGK